MCIPCLAPWLAAILAWFGLSEWNSPYAGIRFILAAFATYRLVDYLVIDDGPFGLHRWLRAKLGVYDLDAEGKAKTVLGRAMGCAHCVGLGVALITALMALSPHPVCDILLTLFGLAGIQSALHSWRGEGRK